MSELALDVLRKFTKKLNLTLIIIHHNRMSPHSHQEINTSDKKIRENVE